MKTQDTAKTSPIILSPSSFRVSGLLFDKPNSEAVRQIELATTAARKAIKLVKVGQIDEATNVFQSVLAKGPVAAGLGYTLSLEGMAEVYTRQGQYDKAADMYRTLVYRKPGQNWFCSRSNDCEIRMRFALVLHHLGLYDEALLNYDKGLETLRHNTMQAPLSVSVTPQNAVTNQLPYAAHLALGATLIDFDNPEAAEQCREAVALRPDFGLGHYYLGFVLGFMPATRAEARTEMETAAASSSNGVRQAAARWLYNRGFAALPFVSNLPVPTPR